MKIKIAILALSALLILGFKQKKNLGDSVGDKAADFSLKVTDDKMHSLKAYKEAKGFVIIFTCNHCPFSIAYEDRIIELQNKYNNYQVIAFNPNKPISYPSDGFDSMKVRAMQKQFNFPYLFDDGQQVYPKYGATRTPHVFLLDKNREVKYIGAIDNNTKADQVTEKYLEKAFDALIKGESPDPSFTKAIDCSIKK